MSVTLSREEPASNSTRLKTETGFSLVMMVIFAIKAIIEIETSCHSENAILRVA